MSNIPYLHFNKDKKSLVKAYMLALIPLLLFGFYKNGILLYQNEFISFSDLFIPLYFYFISALVGFLVALIRKDAKTEYVLYGLILGCSISINTNMLIYPLVLFTVLFITSVIARKYAFNFLALTRIFLIIALLFNSYSYLNVSEKIEAFNYNLFDIFWGYGSGGIGSTSLFFLLISFLILSFNKFYKKEIAISASSSFLALFLAFFLATRDISYLEKALNGSVYFAFLFVASDLYVSPNTKRGMLIYGALIGILSAILTLFVPIYEAGYISILLVSFFIPMINQILAKKYLHS